MSRSYITLKEMSTSQLPLKWLMQMGTNIKQLPTCTEEILTTWNQNNGTCKNSRNNIRQLLHLNIWIANKMCYPLDVIISDLKYFEYNKDLDNKRDGCDWIKVQKNNKYIPPSDGKCCDRVSNPIRNGATSYPQFEIHCGEIKVFK